MRRVLAAALLALAGAANAQIFSESNATWAPGMPPYFGAIDPSFLGAGSTQAMWLPLSTAGCYPSGTAMGSRGEAITLTRATTATYTDCAGVTQTCASGEMRVGCEGGTVRGLLVERAVTNYVLNNRTHPKTAEATGSINPQACVGWHEGTGTMTIAAGTATVTGLSCTAVSPGTLCPFTVTVAGTMAITTSAGTVTKAQIECPGSTKTSEVPTAGTAVARSADVPSVATPSGLPTLAWCLEGVFTPYGGRSWTDASLRRTFSSYAGVQTNSVIGSVLSGNLYEQVFNAPASDKLITYPFTLSAGSTHRVSIASNSGTLSLRLDGVAGGSVSGAGTGIISAWLTPIGLGTPVAGDVTGAIQFDGYLRDFKITKSPLCR